MNRSSYDTYRKITAMLQEAVRTEGVDFCQVIEMLAARTIYFFDSVDGGDDAQRAIFADISDMVARFKEEAANGKEESDEEE